ncbi:type II toxin-antitoxin system prevent-host-death family antitoxin [Nocardia sp. NPDC050793]|uniref:type II toxin-antitoxin system Phd/YefM family antitoxin n=1 Tax=Nocardia sp. NPDC050793 TaxID=3155159 RepID=UPI0033CFEF25
MHASEAQANFTAVLDAATEGNDEVVITRSGDKEPAVVISLREYEALKETAYLLDSRANARRLMESIDNVERGWSNRDR